MNRDEAVFVGTIASGKEFLKLLATEQKLQRQLHNQKQGLVKTRLDQIYAVARFQARIAAVEV